MLRLAFFAHQSRLVSLPVALFFCLALVVNFLALGKCDFKFHPATVIEVDLQWHDGQPFPIHRLAKPGNLAGMGVKQLRALATEANVDLRHCVEKDEMVDALMRNNAARL